MRRNEKVLLINLLVQQCQGFLTAIAPKQKNISALKQSSWLIGVTALLVSAGSLPAIAEPSLSTEQNLSIESNLPLEAASTQAGDLTIAQTPDSSSGSTGFSNPSQNPSQTAPGRPAPGAPAEGLTPRPTTPDPSYSMPDSTTDYSAPNSTPGSPSYSQNYPSQTEPGNPAPGAPAEGGYQQNQPGSTYPSSPSETSPSPSPSSEPEPILREPATPDTSNISPGRATRSGSSYIGIGGNIGIGSGDTAIGEGSFAVFSKIGLTSNLSARPSVLFSDDPTILLPITLDFSPLATEATTSASRDIGLRLSPYIGAGVAISTGDDGAVDFLATGGLDVPISARFTANAAINVSLFDNPAIGLVLGLGYNF